ncbi:helix-turn-helix transcriptional regulator [Nocardia huaxiensis]|uniref:Helix-turn-helix domain-containing protein n=1 Tax=Nocardia huaxiensis TaxID=2755382 RepID=A0A7D6Z9P7_9NOCA|nr:helix-turn-helix transcriptional regulator [Nocardia huaxiensis]QLY30488.1 helix-turn-helix domain-containing protein [Nocardia huaxiensis]UFS95913.1 helix-turn-helix transcriptional regulator [Nocardia huaxiensis]
MADNTVGAPSDGPLRVPTLAEFIRDRRARATTAHPAGLTRKELAEATHASLGYIAKIEQGEALNPGAAILDSLATVLELDPADRTHLYHLAQQRPSAPAAPPLRTADPTLRATLDGLLPHLAAVLDDGWRIVDHNSAFDDALPGLTGTGHVLRWMFTDPRARIVVEEWEREAHLMVGRFRAYAALARDPGEVEAVLRELSEHPDFRRMWTAGHVCIGRSDPAFLLRNPRTATIFEVRVQRYRSTAPGPAHQLFIGLTDQAPVG